MITLVDLEQYRARLAEVRCLREQLRGKEMLVTDSVAGSMMEYPYAETHIIISGYDARKYKRVQDRIGEMLGQCEAVDKWVQEIPDSGDRTIITMHYIEGYSWQEVGQRLGLLRDVVRRRARRLNQNFCHAPEKSPKVPFSPL